MKNRIICLLNNKDYIDSEVALLSDLGYEVFLPKNAHFNFELSNDVIENKYDSGLSLHEDVIANLNSLDLWNIITLKENSELLNQHFNIAIIPFEPYLIQFFLHAFNGIVLCRVLNSIEGDKVVDKIQNSYPSLFREINKYHYRFRFLFQFEFELNKADSWLYRHSAFIPLSMKFDSDTWNGKEDFFIYWQPEIEINSSNRKQYEDFKEEFNELNYYIGGRQLIKVHDNRHKVIDLSQLDSYENNCASVIYLPHNKMQLDMHIINAIGRGVPVVYHSDGVIGKIIGKKSLAGINSEKDLKNVLKRLSNSTYRNRIVEENSQILDSFSKSAISDKWKLFMLDVFSDFKVKNEDKRLAIIMPNYYVGGVLDFTNRMALAFHKVAKEKTTPGFKVVVYHPEHTIFEEQNYFETLENEGIEVRSFQWVKKDKKWLKNYFALQNIPNINKFEDAYFIVDGLSNIHEFDYVILTADVGMMPYYIPTRYSVVAHDVTQRMVQLTSADYESCRQYCARCGENMIATTPPMMEQVINYFGINRTRVVFFPQMLEAIKKNNNLPSSSEQYFIWSTNTSKHKNHIEAFRALEQYYSNGGSIKCYITGAEVYKFKQSYTLTDNELKNEKYLQRVRKTLAGSPILLNNIEIKGNLPKAQYYDLVQNAAFSFHPGYADNGNGALVDAVQLGVPVLSSDYPAMRYMDSRMKLNCLFFEWDNYRSITEQLFRMERIYTELKDELNHRSGDEIDYTWDKLSNQVYDIICSLINYG